MWESLKNKTTPLFGAYLIRNRIPAPIPGSVVSRFEAGLLTEVSHLPPSRPTSVATVAQWQAIGHHSSGNCPGFTPDSLLSPRRDTLNRLQNYSFFYSVKQNKQEFLFAVFGRFH